MVTFYDWAKYSSEIRHVCRAYLDLSKSISVQAIKHDSGLNNVLCLNVFTSTPLFLQ